MMEAPLPFSYAVVLEDHLPVELAVWGLQPKTPPGRYENPVYAEIFSTPELAERAYFLICHKLQICTNRIFERIGNFGQ